MRILGITDGQTSGAAVIEDGRIVAAINEERISRLKLARGFPRASIAEVLRLSNTAPAEIDGVGVAQINSELREEVMGWPGWFEARDDETDIHSMFFRAASTFGNLAPKLPGLKKAYYATRAPVYRHRRNRIRAILGEEFGIHAPVRYFNHHYAHATSAYYTSPFKDALVMTMDGGGDGHCSHVYDVRNGRFKHLTTIDSYDSLGNYYAYITAVCGFKAKRHEGKITGLAARGKPVYRDLLASMICYEEGRFRNCGNVLFNRAVETIRRKLPEGWQREDLAATIQSISEEISGLYASHWLAKTGHRNLAVAGGVFANVRINEELLMRPETERLFVHPGMSDEGLAVGAALAYDGAAHRRSRDGDATPQGLQHVYLGNGYDEREIAAALTDADLAFEHHPGRIEAEIAEQIAQGRVVARFAGKMEYGPRALGNRSILYQPGDPSVNDWLNELLQRTEFMPFAPSCLYERADQLFVNARGGKDTARFMTVTFHCTPWMRERCAGVVHVDGTARPQLVREQDNPSFHRIITEYEHRTGVPAVINTSFNIHEEPIVRSPEDAVRAFLDSKLDYLAIGDFLAPGPIGSQETRKKWEHRSLWGRPSHAATAR
jgi:carbamoyltransferase